MSHLTVSYVSQTPAGTAPVASPAAAAPEADSPLGFLAALVDQLLAGGAEAAKGEIAATTGANVDVPGLLNLAVDATTETKATATAPTDLFAALGLQLDKLAGQLDAGETPSQAQLQDLTAALGALGDAIDTAPASTSIPDEQIAQLLTSLGLIEPAGTKADAAQVATQDPLAALRDRLAALSQTLAATDPELSQKLGALATKLDSNPALAAQLGLGEAQADADAVTIAHIIRTLLGHATADAGPKADPAAPKTEDDLLKVLATLGLNVPAGSATASAGASTDLAANTTPAATAVPAALVRLSSQLSQIGAELAGTSPELAKKLETVATQLVSANADPELLGKLTSAAAQPSGTALDKLVQSLFDAKPVTAPSVPAAPQISAQAELVLPAPTAPKQPKSAVAEVKAAPPEPASVTADSAQPARLNVTAVSRESAAHAAAEPKVEAKVAAVVAEAAKSEPAAPQQPVQPQQAPPAPVQHARILPTAYQPVANPINMGQVAFEMARQINQGSSRFTIRLDPPELGRVDVKMHVDSTGAVNARLTVDRAETLDLFQRDRQSLERALSQAGLDASKTNLEFSLRQNNHNPFAGMMGGDQQHHQPGYGAPSHTSHEGDEIASLPAITLYRGTASAAGVNIFA